MEKLACKDKVMSTVCLYRLLAMENPISDGTEDADTHVNALANFASWGYVFLLLVLSVY